MYVVYVIRGLAGFNCARRYVGLARMKTGEDADRAAQRRLEKHQKDSGKRGKGALWLRIVTHLQVVDKSDPIQNLTVALATELFYTLVNIAEFGFVVILLCCFNATIGYPSFHSQPPLDLVPCPWTRPHSVPKRYSTGPSRGSLPSDTGEKFEA